MPSPDLLQQSLLFKQQHLKKKIIVGWGTGHKQVKVEVRKGGMEIRIKEGMERRIKEAQKSTCPSSPSLTQPMRNLWETLFHKPKPVWSSEEKAGWEEWQGALWVLGIISYRHRVRLGASPGLILWAGRSFSHFADEEAEAQRTSLFANFSGKPTASDSWSSVFFEVPSCLGFSYCL